MDVEAEDLRPSPVLLLMRLFRMNVQAALETSTEGDSGLLWLLIGL
jgi:hypothetical protein